MTQKIAILLDLDSTLVEQWGTKPLPRVAEVLGMLAARGARLAIVTNQAGVAWRATTGQEKFPRPADVGHHFRTIAEALPPLKKALWFVAVYDPRISLPPGQYRELAAAVTRAAAPLQVRSSGNPSWRKPGPGMLWEACRSLGVPPAETILVGDSEADRKAAEAAGIAFAPASEFFAAPNRFLGNRVG